MSSVGIGIAVKLILESMGKPEQRTWHDMMCEKHMPVMWLPKQEPYMLISECLTCWVENELWMLKNKVESPFQSAIDMSSNISPLP